LASLGRELKELGSFFLLEPKEGKELGKVLNLFILVGGRF